MAKIHNIFALDNSGRNVYNINEKREPIDGRSLEWIKIIAFSLQTQVDYFFL